MLVIVTAPLWIPYVIFVLVLSLAGRGLQRMALYPLVRIWIGRSDRRVLFVYSDSPNWQAHVESRILPKLPVSAVVLNWSQRSQWSTFSLPVLLFRTFAGRENFNPIGFVFERGRAVEEYRFWQPFRDAKHGHGEALASIETRFLEHASR